MYLSQFKKHAVIIFVIQLMMTSCGVMLIGAYDSVTDQGIQQIQTDVSTLLVKIEKSITNGAPEQNKYETLKSNYDNIEGEIKSLKIRVASLPKYKIISDQVTLLENNVLDLEKLNKIGFPNSIRPIQVIDSTFQVQFTAMTALQNGLKRQKTSSSH
jgi:hypothetical protein